MIFSNLSEIESIFRTKNKGSPNRTEEMSNSYQQQQNTNQKQTSVRRRRKTTHQGGKDRNSVIYKFMKERQEVLNNYKPRAQMSLFTPEEDQILVMLVKKIGPKFQKISKYFPGKTINMVKNRYYKTLRQENRVKFEVQMNDNQHKRRIIGRNIIEQLPETNSANHLVEESPLFPEAKNALNCFVNKFQFLIAFCLSI